MSRPPSRWPSCRFTEALRALEMDPPDLMVLGLLLPEVNGLDILEAVRAKEETQNLPVVVDVDAQRVTVGEQEVRLSRKEFRLLTCLMRRRGRTQSRKVLLEAVWDTTADIETRTVDIHIRRLRSKLGDSADLVETVRGFGYLFRAED